MYAHMRTTHTHVCTHAHNTHLEQVSHLDEVAMGTDERQDLESKIDDLEDKVDEDEKLLKDVFLTTFKKMVACLTAHLSQCDQEIVDYETLWFTCTLDNCRQLLVKVRECVHMHKFSDCQTVGLFRWDENSNRILFFLNMPLIQLYMWPVIYINFEPNLLNK